MDQTRDQIVPLGLLAIGVAALGPAIYLLAGPGADTGQLIGALLYVGVSTGLGIVALLVAGHFLGVNFGTLGTAILKLAGTFAFTNVLSLMLDPLGCMGFLITLAVFLGLLQYLFLLEAADLIWTALIIWLVQVGAFLLFMTVLFAGA